MQTLTLRIRESFWFLPSVFGIVAIVVAELLVLLDQTLLDAGTSIPFLDALSASGGRSILTTIGTAMLTVAGTSFSITISVLATTSSTYGPRLVRNFMADRANQFVLAAFTSTFLYSIVVLRSVHTDVDDGTAFVPVIAVHLAVVLGIADVAVLVFFIHHIATSVQITSLQKRVQVDLEEAVDFVYRDDESATISLQPFLPGDRTWVDVPATENGYVQSVQWDRLVSWAHEHDRVLQVVAMPGDHVIEDDVLMRVGRRPAAGSADDDAGDALRAAFTVGSSRTPTQDVGFALQQLVEIAVRGLASGTNDPYTAVSALDLSATALVPMWRERRAITGYLDGEGALRVVPSWPSAEELVDTVFDGISTYGTDHPAVIRAALRLAERLTDVAPATRRDHLDHTVRTLTSHL